MKNVLLATALVFVGTFVYGDECVNGSCKVRSRVTTVTKEVVQVPVEVTRKTVEVTRNTARRVGSRVRSFVR